jgi:hypothetical protein
MKYIITEEQNDNLINQRSLFWIKRRYNLVKDSLEETFDLTLDSICRKNTYEEFERYFFSVFMDCLHPYFYEDESFDNVQYDGMIDILKDLFYVECTEFYFEGRRRCS